MLSFGTSFNRMALELNGYEGGTLFIIKHKENDQEFIFGAIKHTLWEEQLAYQGDSQSLIFSLYPQFHLYTTYKGNGGQNYCYFN